MRDRYEYLLDLGMWQEPTHKDLPTGLSLRTAEPSDLSALAALMLDAYRDTIDYEGETMTEAVEEVRRYLTAPDVNRPLLEHSVLLANGPELRSACLVMHWSRRNCPFIAYVISHPSWKRRGLAMRCVAQSLARLGNTGEREVRTIITRGNLASEGLFLRIGFSRVGP